MKKKPKILPKFLQAALLLTTLVYPLFMVQMTAAGWKYNAFAGNYPALFHAYAFWMSAGGILMTAGTAFCFAGMFRRWCSSAAVLCSGGGMTACLVTLRNFAAYADSHFSAVRFTMEPVSELYRDRILPVIFPFLLVCVLSVMQFLTVRTPRREEKEAPKILG